MMIRTSSNVTSVKIGLTTMNIIHSPVLSVKIKRQNGSERMQKQFQVVYETKGVKVVNVWLPVGADLPTNWHTMTYAQQDEWLYEHQAKSKDLWRDEHKGEAVNILPVLSLKAV
jgi:hypothetical protein